MAVPALRIPLGLDTKSFEKSVGDAKSLTSATTDFVVKEFAKMQAKAAIRLAVNNDQFKPAVQGATKFLGDQFEKVKPQIQSFTQAAVKETAEAGLKVASVFASPAIKGSFQAFTAVGVPAVTGLVQSLAPLALKGFVVYEAFHLMGEAISGARDQIAAMVVVADKASNLQVSPQFLQLFEGESRKLKVTIDELDGALSNAFNATKDKSPIDVGKWEAGKERISDVELSLRVYNQELAKTAGTQLKGLVLFREADSQQQKVQAVLTAMAELDKIGQHAASLDVGEKMFGATFVDRIRQGKTSADEILQTMTKLKASGDGIFSDALVTRAKEVDDQLKLSQDRLSRAMKPAWDDLADTVLKIESAWANIVGWIAKAVDLVNKLNPDSLDNMKSQLASVQDAIKNGTGLGGIPRIPGADAARSALGLPSIDDNLRTRAYDLQGKINNMEGNAEGPERPKVSRGTGGAVTEKKKDSDARDPFDVAVDGVEKHIATLNADTAAVFLNKAAQAEFRAEFQTLTALMRSGGEVTQKQIDQYEKYRVSMSASQALTAAGITLTKEHETAFLSSSHGIRVATEAYTKANESLQQLNSASQLVGSALSNAFADAVLEGKNLNDTLSALMKTLAKAAINGAFGSLFNAPGSGGLSPAAGLFRSILPGFASGTDYAPGGPAVVGENGPEIVNLPRGAQVVPNAIAARAGGSSVTVAPSYQIDATGADPAAISRLERTIVALNASLERRAVAAVNSHGARFG